MTEYHLAEYPTKWIDCDECAEVLRLDLEEPLESRDWVVFGVTRLPGASRWCELHLCGQCSRTVDRREVAASIVLAFGWPIVLGQLGRALLIRDRANRRRDAHAAMRGLLSVYAPPGPFS